MLRMKLAGTNLEKFLNSNLENVKAVFNNRFEENYNTNL